MELCEGDQAVISVGPEFGYGPVGHLPLIPENETLIFTVRIIKIESEFENRFQRMNIHERCQIPVEFIRSQAKLLSDYARQEFQKASNKIKVEDQGQVKYV